MGKRQANCVKSLKWGQIYFFQKNGVKKMGSKNGVRFIFFILSFYCIFLRVNLKKQILKRAFKINSDPICGTYLTKKTGKRKKKL